MDKTNFIPFEEFFKKPESEEVAKKTDDEIIEDAYRIRQNLGKLNWMEGIKSGNGRNGNI